MSRLEEAKMVVRMTGRNESRNSRCEGGLDERERRKEEAAEEEEVVEETRRREEEQQIH